MRNLFPTGFVFLVLLACSQSATHQQLVVRAASDLGCTQERIESHELDSRTVVASGCGREATYVEDCETCTNGLTKMNETCDCAWLLNGTVRSRASTPLGSSARPAPSAMQQR